MINFGKACIATASRPAAFKHLAMRAPWAGHSCEGKRRYARHRRHVSSIAQSLRSFHMSRRPRTEGRSRIGGSNIKVEKPFEVADLGQGGFGEISIRVDEVSQSRRMGWYECGNPEISKTFLCRAHLKPWHFTTLRPGLVEMLWSM